MGLRLGLALLLGTLIAQPAVAQEAATVLLVRGGSICAGGTDVVWQTEDTRIWRWRRRDATVSEIKIPPLKTNDRFQGGVQGCVARADGGLDLYYDEYFNIPGTRLDRVGWDANQRVQTIWLSGTKQRPLLTISVPEGGFVEDQISIVPELGVTLHGLEFERVADQLKYKIEVPDSAYVLGVWPVTRTIPVHPADMVVCYAQPPFFSSVLSADYRCALKGASSPGYVDSDHPRFDCFNPYVTIAGNQTMIFPMASYPLDRGMVTWSAASPARLCRSVLVGSEAVVADKRCLAPGTAELAAKIEAARLRGLLSADEYPSRDWQVRLFDRTANRPYEGRLVPAND